MAEPGDDEPGPRRGALGRAVGLLEILGGLGIAALMLLTVSDALMRTFLNRPVRGAGDMTQVILVLVVAVALPLCILAGRAVTIDVLLDRLPRRGASAFRRIAAVVSAAALGLVAWRCAVNAREAAAFGETTMLLQIPYGPFYAALAVAFALSAIIFAAIALRTGGAP